MIKGHIERVTQNAIWGWLWAPFPLAGVRVLAFLDETCIGSGVIEGTRDDIRKALGGDGIAGFNFGLTYPNPAEAPRVVIRLDGSHLVLMQAGAWVGAGQRVSRGMARQAG